MKRQSKYPKTTGYYVYKHILPNAMYYPGMSKQQPCNRWRPSAYKDCSLYPYIEQFGWDNIEHVIVSDGLTKEEAEQLENQLIQEGKKNGLCINKNDSGGRWRDNPTEWKREYLKNNPDYAERQREYKREYQREYKQTEKYKAYQREWQRQYRAKKKALQQ